MNKFAYINTNPYQDTENAVSVAKDMLKQYKYIVSDEPKSCSLALSIGGDGTFIDTAKVAINADIIGINKGTVGHLAEVHEHNIESALKNYFSGRYRIQNRMMLDCSWEGCSEIYTALNDIVISKKDSSVIDIEISVDGNSITRYYADGVIISTPTGSTGYSFSCGAPIIDPSSEMILITPIAPHTIMNRSICISSGSLVEVKLINARGCDYGNIEVDGAKQRLPINKSVFIKKSFSYTKYVKFNQDSFLTRIYEKMALR